MSGEGLAKANGSDPDDKDDVPPYYFPSLGVLYFLGAAVNVECE
jgi:hypothetical protein